MQIQACSPRFGAIYPLTKKQYGDIVEIKKTIQRYLKESNIDEMLKSNKPKDINFLVHEIYDRAIEGYLFCLTGDKDTLQITSEDVFLNTKAIQQLVPHLKEAGGFVATGEDTFTINTIKDKGQSKQLPPSRAFIKFMRTNSPQVMPFTPDKA